MGTAAVGTATTFARSDHVHPLPTVLCNIPDGSAASVSCNIYFCVGCANAYCVVACRSSYICGATGNFVGNVTGLASRASCVYIGVCSGCMHVLLACGSGTCQSPGIAISCEMRFCTSTGELSVRKIKGLCIPTIVCCTTCITSQSTVASGLTPAQMYSYAPANRVTLWRQYVAYTTQYYCCCNLVVLINKLGYPIATSTAYRYGTASTLKESTCNANVTNNSCLIVYCASGGGSSTAANAASAFAISVPQ